MSKRTDYRARLATIRDGRPQQRHDARMMIPDRRICVASDVHLPKHDEDLLAAMLNRCEREGIEAIVWLGDLMDMEAMSSFGVTDKTTSLRHDLEIVHSVIKLASEVVPTQYWSLGNHEARWIRRNDFYAGMHELALMANLGGEIEKGRLYVSDNPSLDAFEGEWMLTHPAQYGSMPLVVPSKLATRYGQNVMAGHAHHWGLGTDETGKYTVVETGGLFDPHLHRYLFERVTAHRAWTQGYWFLVDGEAFGFRPKAQDRKIA